MVERPWITPQEVKDYTDHAEVKSRPDSKLEMDIIRAEQRVISITHNLFDKETDTELPRSVRLALLICADAYAKNSTEKAKKQITSETFDDYSYHAESAFIDMNSLDIDDLLKDYVVEESKGNIVMRLRAL